MDIEKNLELFQELISCGHNVYLWSYAPDMSLLHTNCPPERIGSDSLFLIRQNEILMHHAQAGRRPLIFDTSMDLLWIADFEWEHDVLKKIHMIGPAFSGNNSYQKVKETLDRKNLSVQSKLSVLRQLDDIAILPTNLMFQFAVMLHYCITGEKISSQELQYASLADKEGISAPGANVPGKSADAHGANASRETSDTHIPDPSGEHPGIWPLEQALLNMIREGNPNYKEALAKSESLSSGLRYRSTDAVRHAKNNLLVLLTLCSRAAIDGGLSPSIAYTLQDYYTQRSEDAGTISEIAILSQTLLEDIISRVHQARQNTHISGPVQDCCNYITAHITEKLSIAFLAQRTGYTEYYFSRKFKQETGLSISEYIKREKVKRARLLLGTTTMSISDISSELSFSSYNYFSDTFQKMTGCSPSEYRRQHLKI